MLINPFSIKSGSGVPQGSLIGPHLFKLFVNDVGRVLESNFLLFAYDIKLFCELRDIEDSRVLQRSLDNVSHWCEEYFQLNRTKYFQMHGNVFIEVKTVYKPTTSSMALG